MPLKLKSIINMNKRTNRYVVVGGIWGLINGIYYIYVLWLMSFAEVKWEYMFTQTPVIWKILLLPTYLTHQIIILPLSDLDSSIPVSSPLSLVCTLLLLLAAIVMPILFGIGISLLAANLINKGKKVLKK